MRMTDKTKELLGHNIDELFSLTLAQTSARFRK